VRHKKYLIDIHQLNIKYIGDVNEFHEKTNN